MIASICRISQRVSQLVMPLRRRGEDEFQRPAERAQQHARDHLVVAPRVPDQRRAAAPEFQEIRKTHPRDAVGRVRTRAMPRETSVASFGATIRLVAVTPE